MPTEQHFGRYFYKLTSEDVRNKENLEADGSVETLRIYGPIRLFESTSHERDA